MRFDTSCFGDRQSSLYGLDVEGPRRPAVCNSEMKALPKTILIYGITKPGCHLLENTNIGGHISLLPGNEHYFGNNSMYQIKAITFG